MGFGPGTCSQFKVRRNQVNQRNILHIQQRYPELQSPNGLHLLFILFYLLPLCLLSSKRNFISSVLGLREFFFQLRFRNIDNPIFWIYMTTNLCAYLLTQTPECTWFYNATPDEQWKAKTFADEHQITLFGPVSIENICLVEGQVKDTSPVSITQLLSKIKARNAPYIYTKYQTSCPCPCGNLQRRIVIMQNRIQRSSTQWSSTEARAQQRWRINTRTITPTYTKNRKNMMKGWLTVKITNISSVTLADYAQMLDAFPEDGEWAIVKYLLHLKFSRRYISFSVSIQI